MSLAPYRSKRKYYISALKKTRHINCIDIRGAKSVDILVEAVGDGAQAIKGMARDELAQHPSLTSGAQELREQ